MVIGVLVVAFITTTLYLVVDHLLRTSPSVARRIGSPIPVGVTTARRLTLTDVIGAQGEVQPIAILNLTADVSARVIKITVDLGDTVVPGQILLRFDRELLDASLTTAQFVMQRAADDRARAAQYIQRIMGIYEEGLLPLVEVEKAQAALGEAKVRYREAQERLLRDRRTLQRATVMSPVSGIVMERTVNEGETPQTHQQLFTLGRIDHVLVGTKVVEERLADVHLQQAATVTFQAFPNDVLAGKVVKIKPVNDPLTRTFLVYVRIANPGLKLKPGLTGFVRIQRQRQGLAVPSVALIRPVGVQESTVFVVGNDTTARLRRVKTGVVAGGMTEVLKGLEGGEQVVTVGQINLRDGLHVRIDDQFKENKPKVAHGSRIESMPVVQHD